MKTWINDLAKEGGTILWCSAIFNILETAYFGWNMTAMSRQEEICDIVSVFGFTLGLVLCCIHVTYNKK